MFHLIVAINRNGFALDITDHDDALSASAALQFHPDIDVTAVDIGRAEAFMETATPGDTFTLCDIRNNEPVAVVVRVS